MQGIVGVWLIPFRAVWPAVAIGGVLLAVAVLAYVPGWAERLPPPRAFFVILLSPLAVVIWGGVNWAAEEHRVGGAAQWRSHVLLALAACVLAIAVYTPIRCRRAPRWWLLILCSLAAVVYTLIATFVGGMAIVNDWI